MISSLLKQVMKECGLQQTGLAKVMGVPLDRVKSLTSGKVKNLKREESEALISKLGIRAEWLVTGDGPMRGGDEDMPPLLHDRLEIALATAGLKTAAEAAEAMGMSETDLRWVLAGKRPLDAALLEPLRQRGVDVQYVLRGDGEDRSQVEYALNATELKLLRDYRASSVDVQAVICAAAAAGGAQAVQKA